MALNNQIIAGLGAVAVSDTNGSITGFTLSGNVTAANIIGKQANGNSNISISGNGNINFSAAGNANIFQVSGTGILVNSPTSSTTSAALTGNVNNSLFLYLQNYSSGANATTDLSASSDTGTATTGYVDIGIASSTYNSASFPIVGPEDSYLFAVGNAGASHWGNLVVGAFTDANSVVKIGAGGAYSNTNILLTAGKGNVTIGGNTSITGGLTYAVENITANSTAPTGTINFDILSNTIVYNTTAATGNVTLNFRGNSSTTVNSIMSATQSITATYIMTTTGSGFAVTGANIDGTAQTVKWAGGTAPTAIASATTAYVFTLIKTGSSTYTVLGAQTKYA